MRIIHKKNFVPILCCTYTFLSLLNIGLELLVRREVDWSQINNLQIFSISAVAIFLLSQQYRLEKLPLIAAGIIQYLIFIGSVMGYVWVGSFFMEIAPNGYRDMWVSSTIFYLIGVVVYYIEAFRSVKRQNIMLNEIKEQRSKLEKKIEAVKEDKKLK